MGIIDRKMCMCGHDGHSHPDGECIWCEECKVFRLDVTDFIQYIMGEVSRRSKQITEYIAHMEKTLAELENCPKCQSTNTILVHPRKPQIRHHRCKDCNHIFDIEGDEVSYVRRD